MNSNWDILPFGEVCEISGGSQPPKSNFIYEPKDGYIRLIQVRDYRTDKYKTYIPKEKAKKFCEANDIMIGRYGPPIFGIFSGIEGAYNVALMKAIPNEDKLDREYFRWFLKNNDLVKYVEKTSKRAAGQDGVRKERLYQYPVPIPPLPEQKAIVKILDEAFAKIDQAKANIERNIANAKELLQSKLNEIFSQHGEGWEEKKLKEVCELINGRAYKKVELLAEGKYPVLRVGNLFTRNQWYYSDLELNEDKYINDGDLIYAWSASFGPRIWQGERVIYHYHIWKVEPYNEVITKEFLFHLLDWDTEKIKLLSGTGATMIHVSKRSMQERVLPIPPRKEMGKLSSQIDRLSIKINRLIEVNSKKQSSLDELKKSLLQKAFAGELTKEMSFDAMAQNLTEVKGFDVVEGIGKTDLQAGLTAIALDQHLKAKRENTFHHVKAEKIVHLAQFILNVDFGREPVKDIAGPNDFKHSKKIESRARKAGFYTVKKTGERYNYSPGSQFQSIIDKTRSRLNEKVEQLDALLKECIKMDTTQAEVVATLYAAWNNLIIQGSEISDETIVFESRENWHESKMNIPREMFFNALDWMKKNELFIPKGNGLLVVDK